MINKDVDLSMYVGRDYSKCNCYDLVKEVYKDIFGIELKNYYEGPTPNREEVNSLIVSSKGDFEKVSTPMFGDIVVISLFGLECHIGLIVDNNYLLHSLENVGSVMERRDKYKRHITGYFRHREIAA